jgi:two-component system nitrate/nitrite response regulator NarL
MIKVLVVTDVRLWRDGLTQVLEKRPNLRIVGTAATGLLAITESARLRPDIVLMDMAIPDAADTVHLLGRACPTIGVVGLGVKDVEEDVVHCLEAGIRGYVSRDGSFKELIATIERVTRGEMLCPPRITAALARRVNALTGAHGAHVGNLSHREKEVTALVDQGLSNKQIAQHLQIALATVKNHVHSVLKKLHVRSRREAGHRLNVLRSM